MMIKMFLLLFITSGCVTFRPAAMQGSPSLVSWASSEGVQRLESSRYKVDFFSLANQFEPQSNKLFCGAATLAVVLNAMRVRSMQDSLPVDSALLSRKEQAYLPKKSGFSPFYKRYTQNNVFLKSPKSKLQVLGKPSKVKGNSKSDYGFQLRQLAATFQKHGTQVQTRVVSSSLKYQTIRAELIRNLKTPKDYVVINYARKTLGQPGGGHISPLGAYHKDSDSFLILDVTPNKADWVWVPAELLINAMRTFDTVENRGYLLVSGV